MNKSLAHCKKPFLSEFLTGMATINLRERVFFCKHYTNFESSLYSQFFARFKNSIPPGLLTGIVTINLREFFIKKHFGLQLQCEYLMVMGETCHLLTSISSGREQGWR